jgi:hypothetical protein
MEDGGAGHEQDGAERDEHRDAAEQHHRARRVDRLGDGVDGAAPGAEQRAAESA